MCQGLRHLLGGFLPDRFWSAELGKRPFRWRLHFDGNAPNLRHSVVILLRPKADV